MKLLAAGIIFTVSDASLTYLWIRAGVAREGNVWLAALMERAGVGPTLTLRTALGVGLLVALHMLRERSTLAHPAMWLAVIALGLVNAWHLYNAVQLMPL